MFTRAFGNFGRLAGILGFWPTLSFAFFYVFARVRGDRKEALHYIPVGPYVFYFPLVSSFAGLFTEIFIKESYILDKTQNTIRVIDCGANIGLSLLYIKLQAPNARVMCFEPNPGARVVLERNVRENGWSGSVTSIPLALGKKTGEATFAISDTSASDSGAKIVSEGEQVGVGTHTRTVQVGRLSEYIEEEIFLLKIDTEGAEFEILEDLQETGKLKKIQQIQLEYHFEPGSAERPLSDLLVLLEKEGFKTVAVPSVPPRQHLTQKSRRNYFVFALR